MVQTKLEKELCPDITQLKLDIAKVVTTTDLVAKLMWSIVGVTIIAVIGAVVLNVVEKL